MGLLNIGTSALSTAYRQLQTTGHNISNVNTPGYHRQEALQSSMPGVASGAGFFGNGVTIDTVRRSYDMFLEREVAAGQAQASADTARASQLSNLETLFSDPATGLGASMDDLRAGLADLVTQPGDAPTRSAVFSRADAFAARVRDLGAALDQIGVDVDQRILDTTKQLNGLLDQLGKLNNEIAFQSGGGHTPNDLMDQRDSLVVEVNKLVKANGYIGPDNTVSLFSASGEALLVGATAAKFGVADDPLDPTRTQLVLQSQGNTVPVDAARLSGGVLAGLVRFRDEDLANARWKVGQMAGAIGTVFNAVQAQGIDASGSAGQTMFVTGAPITHSASTNLGTGSLQTTIADPSALQASDYLVRFDGTNYVATRLSDNTNTTLSSLPGSAATLDGLSISFAGGAPTAGDRFMIRSASSLAAGFNMSLSSPARLATALAAIPQLGATNGGDLGVASFGVSAPGPNTTQPVTLTFNANGTFDIAGTGTGNATGVAWTPGQPLSYNGWTLTLKGTPAAGDTLTVTGTASPRVDNRNAKALYDAVDRVSVGGVSFNGAYADLVADVGARSLSAQTASKLATQRVTDATAARDQVAGVNLDEEAARLLQYQQAYQAAAKVIAAGQSMFDTILCLSR